MSATAGQQGQSQLPSKEANLFRQVVRFYETKQYKKGIKAADQILKKLPEHGETLAMKGLILNCLEKKEEAYEHVRKGLKADLRSHVCWHVYGLIYKSDRNYVEACKCYLNALRLDKENQQILRDLAMVQTQTRDTAALTETRQAILQARPGVRANWMGFAISHHLAGNHDVAVQILEAYEATLTEVPAGEAYEHSEMLLYKATVMQEGGQAAAALELLHKRKDEIKDRIGSLELEAGLLRALGRDSEAAALYRRLLAYGPDNYRTHAGLQAAMGLAAGPGGAYPESAAGPLSALYAELRALHPDSAACRRIPLDFLSGAAFEAAADEYVRAYVTRGIPSLFTDLRPLYRDVVKARALGALFERFDAALQSSGSLPLLANGATAAGSKAADASETRVWVLHYLAQHKDRMGDTAGALAAIDTALSLTPAIIELHTAKSKVLRHAGDYTAAAACAEEARKSDLADRYLNSLAAKALFRADNVAEAEAVAMMFTKDGDQINNLHDMQHMWYAVHAGCAYARRGELGRCLKKFTGVIEYFKDFEEDQYDFHSYSLRKMTLRAYLQLLRLEDGLYGQQYYVTAASAAVDAYLRLHAMPSAAQQAAEEEARLAALSPEDRKKAKNAKKKEEDRKRKEAEAAAKEKAEKDAKRKGPAPKEDPDPEGAKLAATSDPLGEATKLVDMLKQHAPGQVATQLAAFEVYSRKGKLLLALSAVQRAAALAGRRHPDVHRAIVRFCLQVQQATAALDASVKRIIDEGVAALLDGAANAAAYNTAYLAHQPASLVEVAAGAEMLAVLDAGAAPKAVATIVGSKAAIGRTFDQPTAASHEEAVSVHRLLQDTLKDGAAAAAFLATCAKTFQWSAYFQGPKWQASQATNRVQAVAL